MLGCVRAHRPVFVKVDTPVPEQKRYNQHHRGQPQDVTDLDGLLDSLLSVVINLRSNFIHGKRESTANESFESNMRPHFL